MSNHIRYCVRPRRDIVWRALPYPFHCEHQPKAIAPKEPVFRGQWVSGEAKEAV